MTSKELNLKLKSAIPDILFLYEEETSWQDGDETGSHIVYADVFVPYIMNAIERNNCESLKASFDFIEKILSLNDEYAGEVIVLSVIESLYYRVKELDEIISYMGVETKKHYQTLL